MATENKLTEVEFDIWLTKDRVPIVIHGLEGTIGLDHPTKEIKKDSVITELSLKEIKSFKLPNDDEIPTFQELLEVCGGKTNLNVEIKDPNIEVCKIVMDLINGQGLDQTSVCFSSFHHWILDEIKRINSNFGCGYLYRSEKELDPEYYPFHGESVNIAINHVSKEVIENIRAEGRKVKVYFPKVIPENQEYYEKLVELGVDTIFSDDPIALVTFLDTFKI